MSETHKFYMQRLVNGNWESAVSILDRFPGMKYLVCEGLSNYGKIKNIYTEDYAEAEELRVYIPKTPQRESTDVSFKFGFVGDNRRDVYDDFIKWISGYKIRYWDNFRNRQADLIMTDAVEIDSDDDISKGDTPFMVAQIKFKNIKGKTEKRI